MHAAPVLHSQVLATLELGPKSNLVVYEMMPTRRRKAIPVHIGPQQHEEPVALAFSADGKLLATLLPEPTAPSGPVAASSLLNVNAESLIHNGSEVHSTLSYSITVYLWRTGKTLASISLGTATMPSISPQASFPAMPSSIEYKTPLETEVCVLPVSGSVRTTVNNIAPALVHRRVGLRLWMSSRRRDDPAAVFLSIRRLLTTSWSVLIKHRGKRHRHRHDRTCSNPTQCSSCSLNLQWSAAPFSLFFTILRKRLG